LEAGPDKESQQDQISTNKKLGVVMSTCHPSYAGNVNRMMAVQAGLGITNNEK
jgi:hypothetical protein